MTQFCNERVAHVERRHTKKNTKAFHTLFLCLKWYNLKRILKDMELTYDNSLPWENMSGPKWKMSGMESEGYCLGKVKQ